MNPSELTRLAFKHTKNAMAEEIYLKTGYDATKPVTFYGMVNERCNVKCRYCEYWRLPKYKDEMSIEQWQAALLSVKDFVGTFAINFSGGEPFIKPGFVDLMLFCHQNGIKSGVTTNGSAINKKNAGKLAEAQPFNVNFSVDGPTAEIHDYLRGWPGLFDKLSDGIRYLRDERDKRKLNFPIIVKPTINVKNFQVLPEMVQWVKDIGADFLYLQPMDRWTPETYDELWIEEDRHEDLAKVVETLMTMKRAGEPIFNSELVISLLVTHFQGKSAPPEAMPCRVGMRDFFIRTDGNIEVCFHFPAIGNIKENSAREIWYGPKAQEIRKQTISCERLCLYTCLSQKTLGDKAKMAVNLLKNQAKTKRNQQRQEAEAREPVLVELK